MKLEAGEFCPLIGKDCIGLKCKMFMNIKGTHPVTGEELDEWDCAIRMNVVVSLEQAKTTRAAAAETAALRRDHNKNANMMLQIQAAQASLMTRSNIPAPPALEVLDVEVEDVRPQ